MNHFHDLLICRDGLFYFSRGPTCVCAHIYIYTSIMHLYTYITYTYRMLREVVFSTDIRT